MYIETYDLETNKYARRTNLVTVSLTVDIYQV